MKSKPTKSIGNMSVVHANLSNKRKSRYRTKETSQQIQVPLQDLKELNVLDDRTLFGTKVEDTIEIAREKMKRIE